MDRMAVQLAGSHYRPTSDVSDRQRLGRMAELEGAREGDPVEEEWSVERVLDKRVSTSLLINNVIKTFNKLRRGGTASRNTC